MVEEGEEEEELTHKDKLRQTRKWRGAAVGGGRGQAKRNISANSNISVTVHRDVP